jgi:F-type H+-transporting ATPase subunit gamma
VSKLQELRQRIRTVEGIQAITRTLATVAAARLSRTRRRAAGLRAYARRVREMVLHQQVWLARAGLSLGALSALLRERTPVRSVALLVIASDRGMCGGYNLEVCRLGSAARQQHERAGRKVRLLLKGQRAVKYFRRWETEILDKARWPREGVSTMEVEQLLARLLRLYRARRVDAVYAVYTEFHSPIKRRPRVLRLLPVELPAPPAIPTTAPDVAHWHYEPGLPALVDELVAMYLRVQLYDVLLESYASEHGARMITMEEASERAERSLRDYLVQHNRLRREAITTDLLGTLYAARATRTAARALGPG